jgi:hypothetical protein
MTRGNDVAQSPSRAEPKWGCPTTTPWPTHQVLAPFQFMLLHRVKDGRCMGYLMPKVGGGRVGWPADRPGFGELPPKVNGGAHSLDL